MPHSKNQQLFRWQNRAVRAPRSTAPSPQHKKDVHLLEEGHKRLSEGWSTSPYEEHNSMNSTAPCYTLLGKVGGWESTVFFTGQYWHMFNCFPKMNHFTRREEEQDSSSEHGTFLGTIPWVSTWGRWGYVSTDTESSFAFLILKNKLYVNCASCLQVGDVPSNAAVQVKR